jgi:trehalose/maltose hydrolase-like predicted phosphorylase
MFPNLVALFPKQAFALTEYRRIRLPAARQRAASHGFGGAMQPWESALTGYGVSRVPTNDDQEIHITGDVPNAFRLYYRMTRNATWLQHNGYPLVRDSANFFASRVVPHWLHKDNLTLLDVKPPDESAGIHNSSAYTNAIAVTTLKFALAAAEIIGETPAANWSSIAERMYLPTVEYEGYMAGVPVHPEYAGYDPKKRPHINQADVALLQYPLGLRTDKRVFPGLPGETNPDQLAINDLLFWQPKSDNQVFYTGDSAYSIAWLELGNRSAADAQFDLAFTHIDLGYFNVWEEKNYGNFGNLNFITGAGGYLQNYINGYAGLRYTDAGLTLRPVLPPHGCESLALRGLALAGARVTVSYTAAKLTATLTEGPSIKIAVRGGSPATALKKNVPRSLAIVTPGQTVFELTAVDEGPPKLL